MTHASSISRQTTYSVVAPKLRCKAIASIYFAGSFDTGL
jgi:hypothetical protein